MQQGRAQAATAIAAAAADERGMCSDNAAGTASRSITSAGTTAAAAAGVRVPYPYGLCAFDIDGTLVQGRSPPSARLIAALAALRARGAAVLVATGRPAVITAGVVSMLGGHVDFLVTANGAGLSYQTAQVTRNPF